jgi:glycosyltransferase 2 family protein
MKDHERDKSKGRIGWMIRLAVSVLVLAAIFYFLPLRDVVATMRRIPLADWVLTLAIFLAGHVVSAFKWQLLATRDVPFLAVLRAHFGGLVANLSLPGVAGGDVVRAALLYRRSADRPRLALGSIADRAIDTVGLLLIAGTGLVLALGTFESSRPLLAGVIAVLMLCAVAVAVALRFHARLIALLPVGGRLRHIGERLGASLVVMATEKGRLGLCLLLSIAVQSAFIAATIRLADIAGVVAPVAAWFFAWPLSKLIATLPISVAGLGVREASLAGFLAPFGAPAASVVGIGLLWQTVQIAGGLIGATIVFLSARALGTPATHPDAK